MGFTSKISAGCVPPLPAFFIESYCAKRTARHEKGFQREVLMHCMENFCSSVYMRRMALDGLESSQLPKRAQIRLLPKSPLFPSVFAWTRQSSRPSKPSYWRRAVPISKCEFKHGWPGIHGEEALGQSGGACHARDSAGAGGGAHWKRPCEPGHGAGADGGRDRHRVPAIYPAREFVQPARKNRRREPTGTKGTRKPLPRRLNRQ